MGVSTTEDSKIASFNSLKPWEFTIVDRILIRQDLFGTPGRGVPRNLDLWLVRSLGEEYPKLVLRFFRVSSLVFAPPAPYPFELVFLTIHSLRERQWEYFNYQVSQTEQENPLSFICRTFEATIVEGEGDFASLEGAS